MLRLCPIIDLNGVVGAAWIPSDGFIDPTQLTFGLGTESTSVSNDQSSAQLAKSYGVKIIEGVEVVGFKKKRFGREERITHVIYTTGNPADTRNRGEIEVGTVVNCAGLWARHCGALMGVSVPVMPVQHQYMVSEKIPDMPANLPTLRDPDNLVYYKPEGRHH